MISMCLCVFACIQYVFISILCIHVLRIVSGQNSSTIHHYNLHAQWLRIRRSTPFGSIARDTTSYQSYKYTLTVSQTRCYYDQHAQGALVLTVTLKLKKGTRFCSHNVSSEVIPLALGLGAELYSHSDYLAFRCILTPLALGIMPALCLILFKQ